MIDFADDAILSSINELIRAGELGAANRELTKAKRRKRPRKHLHKLANLCRRVGQSIVSLKILSGVIYPKNNKKSDASDAELVEYAAALIHVGCVNEANRIFERLKKSQPSVHLQKAFLSMKFWNYGQAELHLEEYLQSDLSEYERALGKVNLLATFIALGKFSDCRPLITALKENLEKKGHRRLHQSVLGLELQAEVLSGNYDKAHNLARILAKKAEIFSDVEFIYVEKWKTILNSLTGLSEKKCREDFHQLKLRALSSHEFETARDSDFYLALAINDNVLAQKLYAGSPLPLYREKIVKAFGGNSLVNWTGCFLPASESSLEFNLAEMKWRGEELGLRPGGSLFRSLQIIFDDFYSAPTLPQFHEKLFPERRYHPDYSAASIHQALLRLRDFLKKKQFPFFPFMDSGFIKLSIEKNFVLTKALDSPSAASQSNILSFKKCLDGLDFKSTDLAKNMGLSQRQAERIIKDQLENGAIEVAGNKSSGSRRRYKFAA
jgi:hypothetical protein